MTEQTPNRKKLLWLLPLPVLTAFLGRLAGGGMFASKLPSTLPEVLLAIIGATAWSYCHEWSYWGILAAPCFWAAIERGHGNAYHMGTLQFEYEPRYQTLDQIVMPICRLFGWKSRSKEYCWLFMGLKGLLIGAWLFPVGLILAYTWPKSYLISFQRTKDSALAEWASFATFGLAILLYVVLDSYVNL